MDSCRAWLRNNILLVLTVTGVFVGAGAGFGLRRVSKLSPAAIELICFPGELFMRMLQMTVLPLVTSSVIVGLATLDPKTSRRIFVLSFGYYLVTTVIAAFVGIGVVLWIAPGKRTVWHDSGSEESVENISAPLGAQDAIFDLLRNIFPENMAQACIEQYKTVYKYEDINDNGTMHKKLMKIPTYGSKINIIVFNSFHKRIFLDQNCGSLLSGRGLLTIAFAVMICWQGMITVSIVFGIVLGRTKESGKMLVKILNAVDHITMKMVSLIMWYSPVGIAFLVAGKLLEVADVGETLSALGFFMLTVLIGLMIQMFIIQPLIYSVLTRKNPITFMNGLLPVCVTAFVTASSTATLPVTIECCERNLKIDRRITHFVLPVGATINMNGTALYEAISAIFIAQLTIGYELTILRVIVISATATVAAMGAAAVPSAGLITMVIVLGAVGLETTHIAMILTVDWLLDRVRTAVNVIGDAFGAGIVDYYCKDLLHAAGSIVQESATESSVSRGASTNTTAEISADEDSVPSLVKTVDGKGDMIESSAKSGLRGRKRASEKRSSGLSEKH